MQGEAGPTLHTTLDSGISSDACRGLTKQRADHFQEMGPASLFCSLSVWPFIRHWFGCLAGHFSASRRGQRKHFPLPTPGHPKCPTSAYQCVSENFTKALLVPHLFPFSLGTKMDMDGHGKERFCFSLLGYSDEMVLSLE